MNPTSLEKALKSLPKTLDKTYERILCGIDEQYCDYARKILYWLTYSARPLTLVEAAEIIAIDARKEPRFNPENRFFDSKEILVICSSLVSVFTGKRSMKSLGISASEEDVPCIKLGHFSVKEYLTSIDIRNGPANMYAISRELADTSIAESCLALLLHFDKPNSLTSQIEEEGALTFQSRENDHSLEVLPRKRPLYRQFEREFPLALYAAENWVKHAHDAGWDSNTFGGLVSEIFLKRDALENWIRLHDPDEPFTGEPDLSKSSTSIGTSMYYASQAGLLKPLKILIEAGADVNAPGGGYGSALQVASYEGHREVIDLLLDKGADINVRGEYFDTALQAASYKGHQEVIHLLLDKGADVNIHGGCFGTALQAASYEGYQQTVQILLDAGADVNAQGGLYGSALLAASYKRRPQIVKMLLDSGADVNLRGGLYQSALQVACNDGNQQIVKMLLDAGADINVQGGLYQSALQAALSEGHQDVVQILRDHGAHEDVKSMESDKDVHSTGSDEDVDSMENEKHNEERDGLQSDSHSILPAATPQTT